ncbi:MAG: hypothetical protein NT001_05280 [Candidatus Woesearchaeota archaeon]|nr:hypothetical protein [Candidatus Woesearchaeota archaeon]
MQTKKNLEPGIFGRRSFITGMAATSAIALLKNHPRFSYDPWAFLIDPALRPIPKIPAEELQKSYPRLGPIVDIPSGSFAYKRLETLLQPHLQEAVLDKKLIEGDYDLYAKTQLYCLPAREDAAASAEDYGRKAYSFLLESLPELERRWIRWTPVSKEDDFSNSYDRRVFLGHAFYEIIEAILVNSEDSRESMKYTETGSDEGGRFVSQWNKGSNDFNYWFICAPANSNLLLALYSEIIMLYVTKETADQIYSVKPIESRYASEAISEAAARIISERAVEKLSVPNGMHFIDKIAGTYKKNEMYALVEPALAWMRKKGVSEGFRVWREEGPDGFTARIKDAR